MTNILQVEERMLVGVPAENCSEEGGTGGQDDLVCLDLLLATRQRHVKQFPLRQQVLEAAADVALEVVPLKAELLASHLSTKLLSANNNVVTLSLICNVL